MNNNKYFIRFFLIIYFYSAGVEILAVQEKHNAIKNINEENNFQSNRKNKKKLPVDERKMTYYILGLCVSLGINLILILDKLTMTRKKQVVPSITHTKLYENAEVQTIDLDVPERNLVQESALISSFLVEKQNKKSVFDRISILQESMPVEEQDIEPVVQKIYVQNLGQNKVFDQIGQTLEIAQDDATPEPQEQEYIDPDGNIEWTGPHPKYTRKKPGRG